MNDLYEINRRLFLTQLCAVGATAALIGSTLKAGTPAGRTQEDAPNTHNMLVVETEAVFLSHLPRFDGLNEVKSDYKDTKLEKKELRAHVIGRAAETVYR